jgi:hypothetical protein
MFPKQFEKIPFYVKTRDFLYQKYRKFIMVHFPQKYANNLYKELFGKNIDWEKPRDLNETINYLAFKTDTSIWSKLADKYRVRDYVKEKGLADILVPLIAKYNSPNEIDFKKLPNQFVLKCNNGSGDVVIIKDKTKIIPREIKNQITNSFQSQFGLETAEPHYLKIKPCIIAEEYLPSTEISVVDYKVWCFNGKPYYIFTVSNRNLKKHTADYNLFDLNWNKIDIHITEKYRNKLFIKKPVHLDEMLSYAKILSQGFPEVRVDFYEVNDKVYFGEMTFTSQCGRMDYFTPEFLKTMGEKIIL